MKIMSAQCAIYPIIWPATAAFAAAEHGQTETLSGDTSAIGVKPRTAGRRYHRRLEPHGQKCLESRSERPGSTRTARPSWCPRAKFGIFSVTVGEFGIGGRVHREHVAIDGAYMQQTHAVSADSHLKDNTYSDSTHVSAEQTGRSPYACRQTPVHHGTLVLFISRRDSA